MIELVDGMIAELVGSIGEPVLTGLGLNRRGFQSTAKREKVQCTFGGLTIGVVFLYDD